MTLECVVGVLGFDVWHAMFTCCRIAARNFLADLILVSAVDATISPSIISTPQAFVKAFVLIRRDAMNIFFVRSGAFFDTLSRMISCAGVTTHGVSFDNQINE